MSMSKSMEKMGQPIAYYPKMTKIFGRVTAAIFFCHFFYWMDRRGNPLGVYKTAEEITEETGLSVKEQRTARKILRDLGVLIETHKRLEHKIYYLIDKDAFDSLFDDTDCQNSRSAERAVPEVPKGHSPKCRKGIRGSAERAVDYINTETTTETTTKTTTNAHTRDARDASGASGAPPPDPLPAVQNPSSAKPPKRTRYLPGFERFWFAYTHPPAGCTARTGGKSKAHEYWKRDRLESIADELVAKVEELWAQDDSWQRGYQPFAQKWINQKRYDDEPQQAILNQDGRNEINQGYRRKLTPSELVREANARQEREEKNRTIEGTAW